MKLIAFVPIAAAIGAAVALAFALPLIDAVTWALLGGVAIGALCLAPLLTLLVVAVVALRRSPPPPRAIDVVEVDDLPGEPLPQLPKGR